MKKEKGWLSCLLGYAKGSGKKLGFSTIFSVISITAGIVPYYCAYRLLTLYIAGDLSVNTVLVWCGIIAIAYLVKVGMFGLSTVLAHKAAYDVLEGLRLRVVNRFMHAPLGEINKHSIGELKNIFVDKIEKIEPPLAHLIPEGCGHLVLPIVSFIALFCIDPRIALASLATFPLSMICMFLTFAISGKNFGIYNESNSRMNSMIVEYIEGIEVIKAFGRAGASYEKYSNAIGDYKRFVVKWMSSTWVTMKLAFVLFPATLLGVRPVSLYLQTSGVITVAEVALAVMLAMSMVTSLSKLEVFSNDINQMKNTVLELQDYLEMPELPEPTENADITNYTVCMKNVRFSYSGNKDDEVLHGIDLCLSEGSFTALVGPSGGGKSTVARLLARFWDATEGCITIGGVDIKDMPLTQLANIVSFVTQDNFLFNCSLKDNIRVGNPHATDDEVYAAAKAACCDEFIRKLPMGYDTPAGDAGNRLSGGEKQRIAIARMILKNAPIVILDEATAFTDPENEDKLQQSISALTKGKTLLVIAHRLSTIKQADNIVVLKDGSVLAQGKQNDLLENCPLYHQMWQAHIGAKNWSAAAHGKEAHNV